MTNNKCTHHCGLYTQWSSEKSFKPVGEHATVLLYSTMNHLLRMCINMCSDIEIKCIV